MEEKGNTNARKYPDALVDMLVVDYPGYDSLWRLWQGERVC